MKDLLKKLTGKYNGIPLIALGILIVLTILSGKIDHKKTDDKEIDDPGFQYEENLLDFSNKEDEVMSIYGIKEIKIKEGSTKAELYYLNPEQNQDRYYIRVSIVLKDSDEILYVSDLIPPGNGIREIELSKPLLKGSYAAVFHIQGYKMNDLSSAKGADLDVTIIVE